MRPLFKRRLYASAPGLHRRNIGGRVVRAIDDPEDRIETAGAFEARLDVRRAEAHRILDLVTRHARAAVRAEGPEEGIVRVEERSVTRRVGRVRSVRVREDLSVRDRRLRGWHELRDRNVHDASTGIAGIVRAMIAVVDDRAVEMQVNGRRAGPPVALVDMEREAVGSDDGSSDGERVARAVIVVAVVVVRIGMWKRRLLTLHEVVGVRAIATIHACCRRAVIQIEGELDFAIAGGPGRHRDGSGHREGQGAERELDVSVGSPRRLVAPGRVHVDSVARRVDAPRSRLRSFVTPKTEGGCNGTAHHHQGGNVDANGLSK